MEIANKGQEESAAASSSNASHEAESPHKHGGD